MFNACFTFAQQSDQTSNTEKLCVYKLIEHHVLVYSSKLIITHLPIDVNSVYTDEWED